MVSRENVSQFQLILDERPIPYDFLIDGRLLRTTIAEYLEENKLSQEIIVAIEYIRSVLPPEHRSSFYQDDWISSLRIYDDRILTGSYDGFARILDQSGNLQYTTALPQRGVKAVAWLGNGIALGGITETIALWNVDTDQETQVPRLELRHHTAPIEALAYNDKERTLLSASADTTLCVWNTMDQGKLVERPKRASSRSNKKQRTQVNIDDDSAQSLPLVPVSSPLSVLSGHTNQVMDVKFDGKDPSIAYSASLDASVRTWDLITGASVDMKMTSEPIISLTQLPKLGLLAFGNTARSIVLHDPRSSTKVASSTLRGHLGLVKSLVVSPESEFMFASGAFDGTVRVWDVRAPTQALFIIPREGEMKTAKVFAVDWCPWGICSAGEDKQIQINQGANLGPVEI